ncbi:MAG: DUF4965 domain-containing protein [Luteolibacter sp.]
MSDALAVTGSRHGLIFEPIQQRCRLLRFSAFDIAPTFGLRAGVRVGEREVIFPLSSLETASSFTFLDQRAGPATWSLKGVDSVSGLIVNLLIACPFRPRDADFSTAPVLVFDLTVRAIGGQFRWDGAVTPPPRVELFLEITGGPFTQQPRAGQLDLLFEADRCMPDPAAASFWDGRNEPLPQRDRLTAVRGKLTGNRFSRMIRMAQAESDSLRVSWSTWSKPALVLGDTPLPFRYTKNFSSLAAVANWARRNAGEILDQAESFAQESVAPVGGAAMDHLLAHTLHSWQVNTWWALQPDGNDWFSVWEGNCYFHSTVDVEFTQAPFYLVWWPELLGFELDQWTSFTKSGEALLGIAGKDSTFLSHDIGWGCSVGFPYYPHEMEVEETANWLLLLYAHSVRTEETSLVQRHTTTLLEFTSFLLAADTDGDGIPDRGVANTIDDGSPAIQYGTQQTYLAVKTLGALTAAALMLDQNGHLKLAARARAACKKIASKLSSNGWAGDHFTVLLEKKGSLKDPWTGQMADFDEIPGWNAPHIYTANTLPILDLAGLEIPLDSKRVLLDLKTATARCLRTYGCAHTDFQPKALGQATQSSAIGLRGAARDPGWISMNMLRDLAALRRGIDLSPLAQRYWDWQILVNTQGTGLFHETFGGNHLHYYPRGVALWGIFDCVQGSGFTD